MVFIWLSFINTLIIQLHSNIKLFAISEQKGIYYEQRFCDNYNTRMKLEIRVSLTISPSSVFRSSSYEFPTYMRTFSQMDRI